jgi:hypothetical protein
MRRELILSALIILGGALTLTGAVLMLSLAADGGEPTFIDYN